MQVITMSRNRILQIILISFLISGSTCNAMVMDNRHIPLIFLPLLPIEQCESVFKIQGIFSTARKAADSDQEESSLAEIYGKYDEGEYGRALQKAGLINPLPLEFQSLQGRIAWLTEGKRQMQGAAFYLHQKLSPCFSCGASWLFMHVNSRFEYIFQNTNIILGPDGEIILDNARRAMFNEANLYLGNTNQGGFGDVDAYLRYNRCLQYQYKFRTIDIGGRLGLLLPSGVSRDMNKPASIPFGGNGHWGLYAQLEGLFEIREDLWAGFFARVQKRILKTYCNRIPVLKEPTVLGVIAGNLRVNPGVTAVLSPYVLIENLRPGLGIGVYYTLTDHQRDHFDDRRAVKSPSINLEELERVSKWGADYATIQVYYDFGKKYVVREFDPIISFAWNIPALFFTSHRSDRANKINLGIEFAY